MLTLALSLIEETSPRPWLWQPPSIFTMADMALTISLLLGLVLLWRRKGGGGVTSREWARLVARIDAFEFAASQREEREQSFRANVLGANEELLKERRHQNNLLEKMLARTEYVADTLDTRPCVMAEANNGDEECPEGHK